MSEEYKIQELINRVKTIAKYEEKLARVSGENFNLFHTLQVSHYEVKTHSPILAELLNPNGSHGQGSIFLKRFTQQLKIESFDDENASVKMEYYIGKVTEDSGGRIDIYIEAPNSKPIIIENKIYATEQENQIKRYEHFSPSAHILFLTLDGSEPESQGKQAPENLQSISYAKDIINWLIKCRKEAVSTPVVRESISQYINLLKDLTNQNRNQRMNKEITDTILQDKESLKTYFTLLNSEADVKVSILKHLDKNLDLIAKKLELTYSSDDGFHEGKIYSGFTFENGILKKHSCKILFQFGSKEFKNLYFGIIDEGRVDNEKRIRLNDLFKEEFEISNQNEIWIAERYHETQQNWNDDTFESILFGNFCDDFEVLLKRLMSVFNKYIEHYN